MKSITHMPAAYADYSRRYEVKVGEGAFKETSSFYRVIKEGGREMISLDKRLYC